MDKLNFSQLWIEEEAYLLDAASSLKDNSVIVDIGTAQGGSSFLFSKGTAGKRIEIFTYDIAPSSEAFENLKNTQVKIISQSSTEGARQWSHICGKPIDLLFIDGSHTFSSVSNDIQAWYPHLSEKSHLMLHDYDPPERGGYPHLGVKIAADAILSMGIFHTYEHVGRLLTGEVRKKQRNLNIPDVMYLNHWEEVGKHIIGILATEYKKCAIIGNKGKTLGLLLNLLDIEAMNFESTILIDLDKFNNLLIYERPLARETKELLKQNSYSVFFLNDLTIYYLLLWAINHHRDEILRHTNDRKAYFKYEEQLEMLNHSSNRSDTIAEIFDSTCIRNQTELSFVIAREIIRLGFLAEIKKSIES